MAKLKVYCTPIGFHDAFIAAPSQKAALQAWGTDKNLFARGAATLVTDPALTKEPLARPGELIKRARGSIADHHKAAKADGATPTKPARRPTRPDRKPLETAQAALDQARDRHAAQIAEMDEKIAALEKERRLLLTRQDKEVAKLEKAREAREATYRRALSRWEG
jgi:hypothetical protein